MPLTEIIDGFFGDCGKGVVTAYLSMHDNAYAAIRAGSPSAGHSVEYNGEKYFFRQIPSAVFNKRTQLLIAAGAFVRPDVVLEEVKKFKPFRIEDRLRIDEYATAILPDHVERDKALQKSIGSVGTGVGPAAADRAMRRADILVKLVKKLKKYSNDVCVSDITNDYLDRGRTVIAEGAHGTHLSNKHGTYPFTNAYDNIASSLANDIGVGPKRVDEVVLVFKSFVSRVGKGPLEGQLPYRESDRRGWIEYGTVSGRRRRVAPFNMGLAKKAIRLNDPTQLAITKADIFYPEARGTTNFFKLPHKCQRWIIGLEEQLDRPITLIKTGPAINDIVDLRKEKGF